MGMMAEGMDEVVANGAVHQDGKKHQSVSFKEKSIFHEQMITFFCSVYGQFVIIIFIAADLALALYGEKNSQFQWLYTYIYLLSILFFIYVCIFATDKKIPESPELNYYMQYLPPWFTDYFSIYFPYLYRVRSAKSHSSMFFLGGIFMFGIAGMIYSGIVLAKNISMLNSNCEDDVLTVTMVNEVLVIAFIFMQTYFIFTNYHMNFVTSKSFVRFGITHVVSTNICMTLGALMEEALHTIHNVNGHGHDDHQEDGYSNSTANYTMESTGCELNYLNKYESKISHYLLPTVIEHGILSTYVIWSMKCKIGRIPQAHEHHHHSLRKKFSLIGSRKGFSCGLLIFIMAFVNIILSLMIGNDYDSYQMEVPHIIILIICITSTFIGFYRINHLRIMDSGSQAEVSNNILLRLALCGAYLFYVLMIVAGFLSESGTDMILTSTVGVLNIVQLTQQIFFMYDITYRILDPPQQGEVEPRSPGRNTVTFLCLCNFTIWIIHTFQAEKYCLNPIPNKVYGELPWAFMVRSALPLMIFFRFHSIDVIGKIWNEVYRSETVHHHDHHHHNHHHQHQSETSLSTTTSSIISEKHGHV